RAGRTQHIGRPGGEAVEQRTQGFQLALAILARRKMGFGRRQLALAQCPHGIGAGDDALLAAISDVHGFSDSAANACRSLCNPDRMRVLMVPSGCPSRAAASPCESPPKNVVSIAWRSAGVSI